MQNKIIIHLKNVRNDFFFFLQKQSGGQTGNVQYWIIEARHKVTARVDQRDEEGLNQGSGKRRERKGQKGARESSLIQDLKDKAPS